MTQQHCAAPTPHAEQINLAAPHFVRAYFSIFRSLVCSLGDERARASIFILTLSAPLAGREVTRGAECLRGLGPGRGLVSVEKIVFFCVLTFPRNVLCAAQKRGAIGCALETKVFYISGLRMDFG